MNIFSSVKWSFFSEVASKLIQPLTFIFLARILTPEDFGLVAAALMLIAFAQIFSEAGMGKAVVQSKLEVQETATAGFWINLGLATLVFCALNFLAPLLASTVIQDERAAKVIHVMSIQVVIGAFAAMQIAILQRDLNFKSLFWVRFATVSVPGIASVPLAISGYSYWSIVIGSILGQLLQVVVLWRVSNWRPGLQMRAAVAKQIARFGSWVTLSALLTWFYAWVDVLIVGFYLGVSELGVYRTGNQFVMLLTGLAFAPLLPVMYSYFSRIHESPGELKKAVLLALNLLRILCVPLGVFLHAYSSELALFVFGEKWSGIEMVISFMALMHMLSWLVGLNNEIYRASGHPWLETIVTASLIAVYLVGYLYAIQDGLHKFLGIRVLLAAIACILHMIILSRFIGISLLAELVKLIKVITISFGLIVTSHYCFDGWLFSLPDFPKIIIGVVAMLFAVLVNIKLEKKELAPVLPAAALKLLRL